MWVTVAALQIMLNDKYKLNHCKEMGAEPGRRFLIQPAAKLEPELLYLYSSNFTPQVKEARDQSQIFNRKSISSNTTHRQSYHLQAMLTRVKRRKANTSSENLF